MSYHLTRRANGIYMLDFTGADGKRKRVSLGTRDKSAANERAREVYIEAITGPAKPTRETEGFTLNDAFDRMFQREWRDARSYRSILSDCGQVAEKIGHLPVTKVTYRVLEEYADACRAEGHAPGTIRKRVSRVITTLRACCRWEDERGRPLLAQAPQPPRVGKPNVRTRWLTEAEERAIQDAIKAEAAVGRRGGLNWWLFGHLVTFLIDTGFRKGEALGLRVRDVRDGVAYISTSKTDEPRGVPLTTRARTIVDNLAGLYRDPDALLFGSTLTAGKVHEMWDLARRRAGIEDATIHDLRRTRGTRLALAGTPLDMVARLLGHRDPTVTFRTYQHLQPGDLSKWVKLAEEAGNTAEYAREEGKCA